MRCLTRSLLVLVVPVMVVFFAASGSSRAGAQELYSFTASLAGGISGALDADPDVGLGNLNLQAGFSWVTGIKRLVGVRLGRMDFSSEPLEDLAEADGLTYLTIAGEYRFRDNYYDSGIYLGLGAYSLGGKRYDGSSEDQTAIGGVLGFTGDFRINPHYSVIVELAGHWVDLRGVQLFGNALVGVAYRF